MNTLKVIPPVTIFALAALSAAAEPSKLPHLPDGQFHSFETGFNIDNPRTVRRAIERFQDEATRAGMQVKPIEFAWEDIEPSEGSYRLREVEERLRDYAERGWRPLVLLRAIDSDDITIPTYLKGTDAAMSLGEIDVSAPRIIDRYGALMERVVPLVRDHGGFAILIANEPDNFLTPRPDLTGRVVAFIEAARERIHRIDPDMAVGVALSNGFDFDDDDGRLREPLPHHLEIIGASDIAVFNVYCLNMPAERQASVIRQRIAARVEAAAGRDIVIQEAGCPSGGAPGLSPEHQRGFFEAYHEAIAGTSVRVSVVFQLVDWTEATIEHYGNALKPILDAEPAFRENPDLIFVYLDQLASIGMVDAITGEPKPAWFQFMKALEGD